jgi:hypothetical protein
MHSSRVPTWKDGRPSAIYLKENSGKRILMGASSFLQRLSGAPTHRPWLSITRVSTLISSSPETSTETA